MNTMLSPQQHFEKLKRHALIVLFICYIPHITTQPAWLFLMFLAAIGYRFLADYLRKPALPWWIRLIIVIACLFLLSGNVFSSGFFIRALVAFIILKCLEIRTTRDLKVLILCNFLLIFSALIVTQDMWIIVYLFVAIFANLSVMIKLSAPEVTLSQIGSKSGQQLLIILPLSVILFFVFPRIDPLWKIPTISNANASLEEKMTPGSISALFNDETTVMQITFAKNPILRGYWRMMILGIYTGETWYPFLKNEASYYPLDSLKEYETADYEILLEPTHTKWVTYGGYPAASNASLLFSPNYGLVRASKEIITKRFAYSIKSKPTPYHELSSSEYSEATQLPFNSNPRLSAWAKEKFKQSHENPSAFIQYLRQYIHDQSFWYTLDPPSLASSENQMDTFWFDYQKGFCEHYASAVTFILRSVGIPSRIVLGYYGGKWNPLTSSVTIPQNTAHAWLEYWQPGSGWLQVDPTSFISPTRIDPAVYNRELANSGQQGYTSIYEMPWRQKLSAIVDSMRFYSERWFVFYNRNTQQSLFQNIGLGEWSSEALLQLSVTAIPVFFLIIWLVYQRRQKMMLDPLLREYHLLQKEFRRFNISTDPSMTLLQQCDALIIQAPMLTEMLRDFIHHYEQLRLMQADSDTKTAKSKTLKLFRTMRKLLSDQPPRTH